jgi:molybdopterin/thiamine biosynthesis adenylyltransferase
MTDMDDQQLLRYSRHILLDEIDIEGQSRLLQAHALVIGAGGLGSPAAMYLASAGVGRITLVDHDSVDLTNLQRQIMHTTARVGQPKVESGARPCSRSTRRAGQALAERVEGERLRARWWRRRCGARLQRQLRHPPCRQPRLRGGRGAAGVGRGDPLRWPGQRLRPPPGGCPCYACLFPPEREFEEVQCSTMGVFSPLVGIIGTMQAAEAIKLMAGSAARWPDAC